MTDSDKRNGEEELTFNGSTEESGNVSDELPTLAPDPSSEQATIAPDDSNSGNSNSLVGTTIRYFGDYELL